LFRIDEGVPDGAGRGGDCDRVGDGGLEHG
jgi:hypothetical protein